MSDGVWYIGPAGDARPFPCPEKGVQDTPVRYGGVHQALSGARTMDTTGYRRDYSFDFTYLGLSETEWAWLEALYFRAVPGPHYLFDPRRNNRLSLGASRFWRESGQSTMYGWSLQGTVNWSFDTSWPTGVGVGRGRSLRLKSWPISQPMRFDKTSVTPLKAAQEQITASIYARQDPTQGSGTNGALAFVLDWYANGSQLTGSTSAEVDITPTSSWARYTLTATPPVGADGCVMAVYAKAAQGHDLLFAAPMLNQGATALPWELGGGCARVGLDQLETSSPRFPLTDGTLTVSEL